MKLKIPCTDGILIDENYCIYDGENTSLGTEGEFYELYIQGKQRKLSRVWLLAYAVYEFPEFIKIEHIRFYRVPSWWLAIPWRPYFTVPYYFKEKYRIVPMRPTLAVSSTGEIVRIASGAICAQTKGNYLSVTAYDPVTKEYRPVMVHTLVANAWVLKNQDELRPVVNHKDGNKYNPVADNLEWTSYQENAQHAKETGLLLSARSCRLRNKNTGEILTFQSVKDVAKFLNRSPDHLYEHRLINHLYNGLYELRLENDSRDWLYTPDVEVMNDKTSRYIVKVMEKDKPKIFNGMQAFIKHYKLLNSNDSMSISVALQVFKRRYPGVRVKIIDQRPPKDIQVKNEATGKVTVYPTVKDAAEALGFHKARVHYALQKNGDHVTGGYRIRYKTNKPWSTVQPKYTQTGVILTDKQTNQKIHYKSLTVAGEKTGIDNRKLRRMALRPHESDKYIVTLIEGSETSRKT